jgi:uncharacterized membrane protein
MSAQAVVEILALLFAGLLAGEELTITIGVRQALTTLDDAHHLALRQALIYRLRVIVPSIFLLALGFAGAAATLATSTAGLGARWTGVTLLVAWLLVTLIGTIPINSAALTWEPSAPPSDWGVIVDRWERLNTVRTLLAITAFVALLVGVALQLG